MPCHIVIHANPAYVEAVYSGSLTQADLIEGARNILTLLDRHQTSLLLADCTNLEGGHSIFDLYALADWVSTEPGGLAIREAVVLPSPSLASDYVRFWETTCFNRGLSVRVFGDRTSALDWLLRR